MFTHALPLYVNIRYVVYCKHIQIALIEILFLKVNQLVVY